MNLIRKIMMMFGWEPKPKRDFPRWCGPTCHGALNQMRVVIESKGIRLKPHDITVKVRTDTRQYEQGWGWYCPELGFPVGALTHSDGHLIEIAVDPKQPTSLDAVHWDSLLHEMGHHWLITNGHGGGHDARFDDVIPGWREARKFTGR